MTLPVPRRHDDRPDRRVSRDRRSSADTLGGWPALAGDLLDSIRDVVPLADVEETDDAYLVEVELPGLARDDVDVQLEDRVLTVSGEISEKKRMGILHRRARKVGSFHYTVMLPGELDEEHVDATLTDGVLTVRVPKSPGTRRRRIPISR